jgi:hypothetical protein
MAKKPSTFQNMETCHTLTKYSFFSYMDFTYDYQLQEFKKKIRKTITYGIDVS